MGRRHEPKATTPPIPRELYPLVNQDGRFIVGGYVPDAHGRPRRDNRWETYKRLKSEYCAGAGIGLADFSAACRADPKFVRWHR